MSNQKITNGEGYRLVDQNIISIDPIITPKQLKNELQMSHRGIETVLEGRRILRDIFDGKDNRIAIVPGPCSIHNLDTAYFLAEEYKKLDDEFGNIFKFFMRFYVEKPRTGNDWEGFATDPDMDGTCDIEKGLRLTRKALIRITGDIGIPIAMEYLDTETPQYVDDLVSYPVIGARSARLGRYRKMGSGLSAPFAIKNSVDGDINVPISGIKVAVESQFFRGIDENGQYSKIKSSGNIYAHPMLRGGKQHGKFIHNYHWEDVEHAQDLLRSQSLNPKVAIDCSHGNSSKNFKNQPRVFHYIIKQIFDGNDDIVVLMLESHIKGGNQKFKYRITDPSTLKPDKSITDSCISNDTLKRIISEEYKTLKKTDRFR